MSREELPPHTITWSSCYYKYIVELLGPRKIISTPPQIFQKALATPSTDIGTLKNLFLWKQTLSLLVDASKTGRLSIYEGVNLDEV